MFLHHLTFVYAYYQLHSLFFDEDHSKSYVMSIPQGGVTAPVEQTMCWSLIFILEHEATL